MSEAGDSGAGSKKRLVVLRPRDVAERWQCSERFVRNMIDRNALPHFKLGGKLIRIALADVEEYERQQRAAQMERRRQGADH